MARVHVPGLTTLARMYGVQTAFYDLEGRRQQASPQALLHVLRALGAPIDTWADVPDAVRERRQELCSRALQPVAVAWDGQPIDVEVRLPVASADATLRCQLTLESGDCRSWSCDLAKLPLARSGSVEGMPYLTRRLALPFGMPWGYHRLTLEWKGKQFQSLIISAPLRAYPGEAGAGGKGWGVFLPLYALCSRTSWAAGDLADLESLLKWVGGLGGRVVATLPLLATFLDDPLEPSPYAAVSRLFWNEFYINMSRVPELRTCPSASAMVQSAELEQELESLRSLPLVDYRRQMALKRKVLEEMARCFFAEQSERHAAFRRFVEAHPLVQDYARFRATVERRRAPWRVWPQPLREGVLAASDYDEAAKRYHLYVQWLAHEQMQAVSASARSQGMKLCLDLPLGVHPDGYDVWRERGLFASGVAAGSPPDTFFTRGQNWGFPPLHPEAMRKQGYEYLIACLQHHLQHAAVLRVDHIMSLHHLFWIPEDMEAREGVYVRYPSEELYAILCVESHRHQALIAGEDLGTVPRYVRPAMARHNIHRTYVVQFELQPGADRLLSAVPAASLASLNTHDMPPFAAFWRGLDIDNRLDGGLLDNERADAERTARQALKAALVRFLKSQGLVAEADPDESSILRACLAFLSASPARLVLVGLEDLWLETRPQNVPGTSEECPNWRRKAGYTLEEFRDRPEVIDILREMDRLRK
ncbi:MAG: 4-alpha-glucanotransferase [Dehalococcoidia bacterium]